MSHNYNGAPPPPIISPTPDVSRRTLKQLARWIRDDLDTLVSREGPGVLRPDDVVTLHEYFVALRQSTSITARDLRATGIHMAVKDVSGIATRWPGRLCDECDKIIQLWTSKFGPFEDLHPFLYGRGGRLEGIGSVNEYTRKALLERWGDHCPEKINPKVSHRKGSLGFSPGSWWINSLFAHHAGIIGLESVEGGTTFDQNGAYALVLKDTGEVDARDEYYFTYRCPDSDKGRFRLTAATARSREPLRVLRIHCTSSIWGPKAGVRYEGLYSVKGWCIRQATAKEIDSGAWKEGDIIYEVSFERTDPVSMEKVSQRPTNMEVDDYAEYKRLRKIHQEHKHTGSGSILVPASMVPVLSFPQAPINTVVAPQSLLRMPPSITHKTTFREPLNAPRLSQDMNRSPLFPLDSTSMQDLFLAPKKVVNKGDLDRPSPRSSGIKTSSDRGSSEKQYRPSLTSSDRSIKSELKEIIPWIELEPKLEPEAHISLRSDTSAKTKAKSVTKPIGRLGAKAAELNPVKNVRRQARDSRRASDHSSRSQKEREWDVSSKDLSLQLRAAKPILEKKPEDSNALRNEKHAKRVAFRKHARFFDGTGHVAEGAEVDEDTNLYERSPNLTSRTRHFRSSSAEASSGLYSPIPTRPPRAHSLVNYGIEDIEFTSPLDRPISRPGMASPVNCFVSSSAVASESEMSSGKNIALGRLRRWLSK